MGNQHKSIPWAMEGESTRLQREANLDADPRATLLVDMWDPVDWDRLWWVRVRLIRIDDSAREEIGRAHV